jgi:hypothetical protein
MTPAAQSSRADAIALLDAVRSEAAAVANTIPVIDVTDDLAMLDALQADFSAHAEELSGLEAQVAELSGALAAADGANAALRSQLERTSSDLAASRTRASRWDSHTVVQLRSLRGVRLRESAQARVYPLSLHLSLSRALTLACAPSPVPPPPQP